MSLCRLSSKSVQRINAEFGVQAVNIAAHHDGRTLYCVAVGGVAFELDRRTGAVEFGYDSTFRERAFTDRLDAMQEIALDMRVLPKSYSL